MCCCGLPQKAAKREKKREKERERRNGEQQVPVKGVQQVRESKYIMMHAPRSALKAITDLLPGAESPTVLPLGGIDNKVAVHVVCREAVFWDTLENLKAVGASSILVLPVEKMLA